MSETSPLPPLKVPQSTKLTIITYMQRVKKDPYGLHDSQFSLVSPYNACLVDSMGCCSSGILDPLCLWKFFFPIFYGVLLTLKGGTRWRSSIWILFLPNVWLWVNQLLWLWLYKTQIIMYTRICLCRQRLLMCFLAAQTHGNYINYNII